MKQLIPYYRYLAGSICFAIGTLWVIIERLKK